MNRVTCAMLAAISLAVLPVTRAHTQAISGQVIDSLSGAAIGNGFVAILDESGVEVGRTLTSSTGRFAFYRILPGRYRLRSERIGYRARETEPIEILSGATLEYTLRVTSIPVRLAAVDVRGERRCGSLEEAPGFGDLWEEARKALRAASWSADHQQYFYRLQVYRRVLDTRRRRILRETVRVEEGVKRVPYVSWAADSLLQHGYVVQRAGLVTYYGPDANVLLDPSFQTTHCFRAVRGEGEHSGMLGLAFEPIPDRRQADIRGTLWVDETSSELRGIDYSYTRLRYNTHPSMGGSNWFARMPTGAWVIVSWEISVPVTVDLESLTGHERKQPVAGMRDVGEEVIEITDMLGNVIYRPSDLTILRGTVYDSIRGHALANERVVVVGTGYQGTTQNDGRFEIPTLLEGGYQLSTARMDSLGYSRGNVRVEMRPADTAAVSLVVPSLTAIHDALCGRDEGENILVGALFDPVRAEPVSRGQLVATWTTQPSPSQFARQMRQTTRTDQFGRFVLCRLPAHETITLQLRHDDFDIEPIAVQFQGDSVRINSRGAERSFPVPERIWRLAPRLRVRP